MKEDNNQGSGGESAGNPQGEGNPQGGNNPQEGSNPPSGRSQRSGGYRRHSRFYGQSSRGRQDTQAQSKEWKLVQNLLEQSFAEQRKSRRWGIVFKSLGFVYFFLLLWLLSAPMASGPSRSQPHTALIQVNGEIAADQVANSDDILAAVKEAFLEKNAKGVVLRINSPGGSPVEAGIVYDEIKRLRSLNRDKKVYAVITDAGASGAYYIAIAADGIYANQASIVGSIGVVAPGFGYNHLIEKIGVERRIFSSGANKAMLDPFSPLKSEDVSYFEGLLKVVHRQFADRVKESRGERLKSQEVFSGLFWTGEQALELGLIDGLGAPGYVAREIVGVEQMIDYSQEGDTFARIARSLGAEAQHAVKTFLGKVLPY